MNWLLETLLFGTSALFLLTLIGIPIFVVYYRTVVASHSKKKESNKFQIGIFHPYCNDGGGGERVLWEAVKVILKVHPSSKISIYTGDLEYSPREILIRVKQRFNIDIPNNVNFIYLRRRKWLEAVRYPYFTLLGQSLGSMWLGLEALSTFCPDLYFDTTGYAFTYPLFKYIGKCKVATYTHYPTITSEMLRRVSGRVSSYNNRPYVANSPFFTAGKLVYYRVFSMLYAMCGRCADVVMVNSTWTEDHINDLWQRPLSTHRVYPPCDVEDLKAISHSNGEGDNKGLIKIISLGQFRPEKNHPLQLKAMYQLRQLIPEPVWDRVRLVLIGACRNSEDEQRVTDMMDLCKHLSLENNVVFKLNIPYHELKKELSEACIGLHAMWNEHFGIGVVECMAAGLVTIAHRSGGPKADIIVESDGSRNGFLAAEDDEFAQAIVTVIRMTPKQREAVIAAARSSVDRFSTSEFEKHLLRSLDPFFKDYTD